MGTSYTASLGYGFELSSEDLGEGEVEEWDETWDDDDLDEEPKAGKGFSLIYGGDGVCGDMQVFLCEKYLFS